MTIMSPLVQLAVELINVQSLSGYEQPMADWMTAWLIEKNWIVERQRVDPQAIGGKDSRYNIYARRRECTRPDGPLLLLNSHIDTVPPYIPSHVEVADDGDIIVWGRGACDTKGILAAQLTAAQELVDAGETEIGLLYVVSEETDHSGMLAANDLGLKPDWLVVGEPTELKLMKVQKGMLKAKLTCQGKACHSGYPELGRSAIDPMVSVLKQFQDESWPSSEELGSTTLNVGLLEGGQAANALAEHSSATIMFRLTTDPSVIISRVQEILEGTGVALEVLTMNSPTRLSTLDGFPIGVAAYNTDIPYFKLKPSAKAFLYGPGSIHHAHSRDERITLREMEAAVEGYKSIIRNVLGR